MRTLNPRNLVSALHKKPEENKIQAHYQQTAESQGWTQNLKSAKQGTHCAQEKLGHKNDSRLIAGAMVAGRGWKVFTVQKNETTSFNLYPAKTALKVKVFADTPAEPITPTPDLL